jgi:hypothetical protein
MNPAPLYEKSTLALSRRAVAHLRDYRLLNLDGMTLDEPTLLRLGQHLADAAERFLATAPTTAPGAAPPANVPAPRTRVPAPSR